MVIVYVWRMTSILRVGHAALEMSGIGGHKIYISWWPVQKSLAAVTSGTQPSPHISLTEDVTEEGQTPNSRIEVRGLDEARLRESWRRWLVTHRYQALSSSCATTVAETLRAGGGDSYAAWPHHLIWNPNQIEQYVREINSGFWRLQAMQTRA